MESEWEWENEGEARDSSLRSPISSQEFHRDSPHLSSFSISRWKINSLFRQPPSPLGEKERFPRSSIHFLRVISLSPPFNGIFLGFFHTLSHLHALYVSDHSMFLWITVVQITYARPHKFSTQLKTNRPNQTEHLPHIIVSVWVPPHSRTFILMINHTLKY